MSSSTVALAGSLPAAPARSEFLIEWRDADGAARAEPVREVGGEPFELAQPVRSFASYRGQRNWPGLWWSATMSAHVGYESWLERDQAMLLDFDCGVVAFAAQPFWLRFTGERGPRSHAPDCFARRVDGSAVVIDCRPDDRIRPSDAESFAATARACEEVGWDYQRNGSPNAMLLENVRWLSGYRNPRFADESTTRRLCAEFADGRAPDGRGRGGGGPAADIAGAVSPVVARRAGNGDVGAVVGQVAGAERVSVTRPPGGAGVLRLGDLGYLTYDCAELNPHRGQSSGLTTKSGRWEVHYDPYDLSHVWVRAGDGHWLTVPWIHHHTAVAPFADFTLRHVRRVLAERGEDSGQHEIARALDALLIRAGDGPPRPLDKPARRVAARTRAAAAHPLHPFATDARDALANSDQTGEIESQASDSDDGADEADAVVIPFGVFDAHAEARRVW